MNRKSRLGLVFLFCAFVIAVLFYKLSQLPGEEPDHNEDLSSLSHPEENKPQPQLKSAPVKNNPGSVPSKKPASQDEAIIEMSGKYSVRISQNNLPSTESQIQLRNQYLEQNRTSMRIRFDDQDLTVMKLRASLDKSNPGDKSLGHELVAVSAEYAQRMIIDDQSFPVVYRQQNGKIGIITGVISVRMRSESQANRLSSLYPVSVQSFDPAINQAYLKVKNGSPFMDVYSQIKQDHAVQSANIEILESYKGI